MVAGRKYFTVLAVVATLVFSLGLVAESSVPSVVLEQFSGQAEVILPDGKVIVLEPGLPIPAIPFGSTLNVISGEAVLDWMGIKISLPAGSAVKIEKVARGIRITSLKGKAELFIGLMKVEMDKDDAVVLRIDPQTREVTLSVMEGRVSTEQDGVKRTLSEGNSISVKLPYFPDDPRAPKPEIPEPERIEASPFMI